MACSTTTVDRLVVDSNVLISASLSRRGAPARLLNALHANQATLLFSRETQSEWQSRLLRTKFDPWVSRQARLRLIVQLDAVSEYVAISGYPMGCRDPDDDKFLETAVIGRADVLVTGDADLLVLHPFQSIPILTPDEALRQAFPDQ